MKDLATTLRETYFEARRVNKAPGDDSVAWQAVAAKATELLQPKEPPVVIDDELVDAFDDVDTAVETPTAKARSL